MQARLEAERAEAAKAAAREAERRAAEEAAKKKPSVDTQSAAAGVAERSNKSIGLPQGSASQVTESRQSAGILDICFIPITIYLFTSGLFMPHNSCGSGSLCYFSSLLRTGSSIKQIKFRDVASLKLWFNESKKDKGKSFDSDLRFSSLVQAI